MEVDLATSLPMHTTLLELLAQSLQHCQEGRETWSRLSAVQLFPAPRSLRVSPARRSEPASRSGRYWGQTGRDAVSRSLQFMTPSEHGPVRMGCPLRVSAPRRVATPCLTVQSTEQEASEPLG